jgi:hypothetical protein
MRIPVINFLKTENMKNKLLLLIVMIIAITSCNFDNQSNRDSDKKGGKENVKTPYHPKGLDITYANWHWENANIKEFQDFTISLSNKTDENFKMVKYRLTLYVYENDKKKEVFSKPYEYNQVLNSGDIIRIPINDLNRFYMGVDVSEDSNWTWTGHVEDSETIK